MLNTIRARQFILTRSCYSVGSEGRLSVTQRLASISADRFKTFSEDSGYVRLAYEGIRVDIAYDAHDLLRLVTTCKYSNDVHGLLGVPPHPIQHSHATVDGCVDGCGNLGIVVLRINEEL